MQLFHTKRTIDFMGKRHVAMVFSLALVAVALVSLFTRGLVLGVDFTGGTLIEVGYPAPVDLAEVRETLGTAAFRDAQVQHFGASQDVLIRVAPQSADSGEDSAATSNRVLAALKAEQPEVEMRRVEFVGPQVGEELAERGGLAVLYALIGILIYVALRFEYRFAVGAVAAVIHDALITVGFFSLLGLEFDLSVLAAVLAVIGYSLNDTIVVFDRIRENFRRMRKGSAAEVMNTSITQTLSRTLITSGTTLLVLLALFFLGGEVIHNFALALIVGIVIGTYSSIYVASSASLALGVSKQDLMPVKKEGAEADDRP